MSKIIRSNTASFEGTIPDSEYGGGTVMLWDTGTWEPQEGVDVDEGLRKGKLAFLLHGERLKGKWALVRLRARNKNDKDNWLLIKELDDYVRRDGKLIVDRETTSVKSGRTMEEIAGGAEESLAFEQESQSQWRHGDPIILARPGASKAKKQQSRQSQDREDEGHEGKELKKKRRAASKDSGVRRAAARNPRR